MNDNTGQNLKPVKFGMDGKVRKKVDQFGQVNSTDEDYSAGNSASARESIENHKRSDVDASRTSQHHTLGNNRNQSAPGDHVHDGVNGKRLGLYEMDPSNPGKVRPALVVQGAKGGNVALASVIALLSEFIDFRDLTT